jgi:hypothetical protein
MPIPKPKTKETQKEFVKRCMSNEVMITEYPDTKQRFEICYTQYDKK